MTGRFGSSVPAPPFGKSINFGADNVGAAPAKWPAGGAGQGVWTEDDSVSVFADFSHGRSPK